MLSTIRRELRDVDGQLSVVSARTMTMHRDQGLQAWTSGFLYRVSPFDPATIAIAAALVAASAMLACYLPARRAILVVPLEALRSE
jgi:ABC-type lipoprotein release transport system permease subunit